mgnify:CR=1 FL=1
MAPRSRRSNHSCNRRSKSSIKATPAYREPGTRVAKKTDLRVMGKQEKTSATKEMKVILYATSKFLKMNLVGWTCLALVKKSRLLE